MSTIDTEVDHYLRAVTELGDTREIIASRDIYSENGTKLIAAGIRITSKLYEKLVDHKLQLPLDMSVSTEPPIGLNSITDDLQQLIDTNPIFQRLAESINQSFNLKQLIGGINMPPPLYFRLTVSKEKFLNIYQRALSSVLLTLFIAHCEKMHQQDAQSVAIAALFHNIGMMHVDPTMLAPSYRMNSNERRHIYAHPVTAYMLLKQFPELSKAVSEAILEHHERMDGRGYPRGLTGDKISRYGQILGIAVVSANAFESNNLAQLQKLAVTLKVSARQYGNGLIGYIVSMIDQDINKSMDSVGDAKSLTEKMKLIANVFAQFNIAVEGEPTDQMLEYAKQRVQLLRMDFQDVGIDLSNIEDSLHVFDDHPELAHEYIPLVNEALWQLKSILLDISRRWPQEFEESVSGDGWLTQQHDLLLAG